MKRILALVLCAVTVLGLLSGCAASATAVETIHEETVALAASPAAIDVNLTATHPGEQVKSNAKAEIDYSNASDGYVMARFTQPTDKKLKCQVSKESETYTYNLKPDEWAAFPLSCGDGEYKITVFENASGNKYATVLVLNLTVKLADEFAPFLRSNQYVNFDAAPETVKKAESLTKDKSAVLDKVAAVYDFVIDELSYDHELARTVQSGYLPELDSVLRTKKGICFDYASLMTGMLRSQDVPSKLVVGFADREYHAWVSVWSPETGWIENVIQFDGASWRRMDPTFASANQNSRQILDYIADDTHYVAKYFY